MDEAVAAGADLTAVDRYLADPQVSEILVNGAHAIWVERAGLMEKTADTFQSEEQLEKYARRALAAVGRKIDWKTPFADSRLPDGSRLCVVMKPAVLGGMHLSIRKFVGAGRTLTALMEGGFLQEKSQAVLREAVAQKKNILISGATGTGKTTLLNAVAAEISPQERIITLEDVAELTLSHPHVVRLEGRPVNLEGEGEITIRTLLRTAMRLRPDRLIVGECRGAEALDLIQAFNTGHAGSMATIHANSPRDALARLELLALLSGENLNPQAVRAYIAAAIHLVVQIERVHGKRQVKSIQEIRGIEDGVFLLKNLWS